MRRPNYDIVGLRRRWLIVSAALMLMCIGALTLIRLDLSIDFTGGSSFVLDDITEPDITAAQLGDVASDAGAVDVQAQVKTEDGEAVGAIVQTGELDPGSPEELAVKDALVEATGARQVDVNFVGPTWGARISAKALQALVVFIVIVALYISVRLEAKMAGGAIVALVHDLLLTAGVYAIVGFKVSPATVIALLTIMGYSLYDTVVVYDRVKEQTANIGGPGFRTYGEAVNTSLNDVLWRSINTSVTSVLPVGSLLFVGSQLLGADTLQDLALALFIGMATGTYSSIFVAGPFLAWWKEKEPQYARLLVKDEVRVEEIERKVEAGEIDAEQAEELKKAGQAATPGYVRGRGKKPRSKRR